MERSPRQWPEGWAGERESGLTAGPPAAQPGRGQELWLPGLRSGALGVQAARIPCPVGMDEEAQSSPAPRECVRGQGSAVSVMDTSRAGPAT